jgi:Zn-dependent peptidase ImmA (M78 family)/transcriptional regulator with XRE-family HTH domain
MVGRKPITPSMSPSNQDIAKAFDGDRLRQARQLELRTKQSLADSLGISAAAIGQYESGATPPRAELIPVLADELGVPREFFAAGRPLARLETGNAYFRSLRSTTAKQRAKAISYTEQLWELVHAVEKHVRLPRVNLPGFVGGEIGPDSLPTDPVGAARALRKAWGLGTEPVPHLIRTIENQGIVTVLVPFVDEETARIDAFSTLSLSRPIIVLSPDRANDVYRHRFTAAHELGHLVLHGECTGGDPQLEREADRFAAEFLTPRLVIHDLLPRRVDFRRFNQLSQQWGVSIKSLIYRCREVGLLSDATARRAYIRLNQLTDQGVITAKPIYQFVGEVPSLLRRAVELAEQNGVTIASLAQELAWEPARVRRMVGDTDQRPSLRLV